MLQFLPALFHAAVSLTLIFADALFQRQFPLSFYYSRYSSVCDDIHLSIPVMPHENPGSHEHVAIANGWTLIF